MGKDLGTDPKPLIASASSAGFSGQGHLMLGVARQPALAALTPQGVANALSNMMDITRKMLAPARNVSRPAAPTDPEIQDSLAVQLSLLAMTSSYPRTDNRVP